MAAVGSSCLISKQTSFQPDTVYIHYDLLDCMFHFHMELVKLRCFHICNQLDNLYMHSNQSHLHMYQGDKVQDNLFC